MESLYPAQDMRAREGCCKPLYGWRSPYTCFAELHTHNLQAAGSVGGRVRARARRHPRLQARALPAWRRRGGRARARLHNVLVLQHVLLAHLLRAVLDARAPHQRVLELL